jgi:catechol 2,3-dioxygenase-like lactoylglutathione lyase family enzyme
MLRKIDRIILRVPGLAAAVNYYRDVLGLTLVRPEAKLASFRLAPSGGGGGKGDDGTELVLHADPDLPAEAVYFLVDDVRDLYKRRASLKLTFTGPPTQVSRGYRATVKDPFGTVLLLLDRSTESAAGAGGAPRAVEDAKPAGGSLFAGVESKVPAKRDLLVKLYEKVGRTADDLPYTPHFENLYSAYAASHGDTKPTRGEVWRHLLNVRKAGKLPKLGEARSKPPPVPEESRQQLREMLGEDIGKRDRLPYTTRFDEIVDAFNRTQPRPLSPHLVWRLVATLAK